MQQGRRIERRSILSATAAAVGVAVTASACSGKDAENAANEVEIFSWWTGGGEAKGLEAMRADFEKRNPGITFKNAAVAGGSGTNAQAVLASRLQAGNPPDSFQGHAGAELLDYIEAGQLEPLDKFYNEHDLQDVFPKQLIEQITHNGKIYSVPVNIHRSNMLWYNPKVLQAAGISEPATTLADFITQLRTIGSETEKIPISLGAQWTADHLFESILLADLGLEGYNALWNPGADWSGPKVTEAVENFETILTYANIEAASTDWQVAAKNVVDGRAAYNIMGDWAAGYFEELGKEPEVDYEWAPSPGTDGIYLWLSDSFTLPKGAPHRPAAIKWLEECASKRGQDLFNPRKGSIPARKDADTKLYKGYLSWALEEWKTTELAGSYWHGVVANNKWKGAIDQALGVFLQNKDVAGFQQSLVDAAEQHGKG